MLKRSIIALGLTLCAAAQALAAAPAPAPDNASVELVEFADFQCPFSGRSSATVLELRQKYGPQLTFRYLHLPLPFHEKARAAAIAAEAARAQGKFDLMWEKLFVNQQKLDAADVRGYAEAIGLDMARFDKDIADPAFATRVDIDMRIAAAVNATGTPTFFVNGKIITGAQPMDSFTKIIDEEIAAAGKNGGPKWRSDRAAANNPTFHKYVVLGDPAPEKVVSLDEQPPAQSPDATLAETPVRINTAKALMSGKGKTQVVVFGGMQCPFTARAFPKFLAISDANAKKVTLVYKHMPLPHHPMSRPAAEAVACANEQKKGVVLASAIFAHPTNELTAESLDAWSTDAGIDMKKQKACLAAGRGAKQVDQDLKDAEAAQVKGTPTVFVNGKRVSNWTAPNVEALILAQ